MKLIFENADRDVLKGLEELSEFLNIGGSEKEVEVDVEKLGKGLLAEYDGQKGRIGYSRKSDLFRAAGILAQHMEHEKQFSISEEPAFKTLSLMVDNSRNAVLNTAAVKRLIRVISMMGYTSLMLYTEDTYEVPGYPYFGYMRGRFTRGEIHEVDEYANLLGIELIPCIQTLAHLNAALRWPAFKDVLDCKDILLAGEDKTYELIDAMIGSAAKMFSSRTINIGMDEAEMLGLGKYLERNGYQNSSEIMKNHLARVIGICNKYGFKPMMWSDMFFKMANGGEYYKADVNIPEDIIRLVPEEVSLVYWDYYNMDKDLYDKMIDGHLAFNNPIIFAGGAWKWNGFAPDNSGSFKTSRPALKACMGKGIDKVIVTAWGDNGAECSTFAILPVLQLFAEECYGADSEEKSLASRLRVCAGADFEDFMSLDLPNYFPENKSSQTGFFNPSKYMLYQDVLCGLFDRHIKEGAYNVHYRDSALRLKNAALKSADWAYVFETLASLCEVLEIKCDLGVRLKRAYDDKDTDTLKKIAYSDLPELIERLGRFCDAFRKQWLQENKAFGLEVMDIRLGGLTTRLNQTIVRIDDYLDKKIEKIEELEQERLYYDSRAGEGMRPEVQANSWDRIVSACDI